MAVAKTDQSRDEITWLLGAPYFDLPLGGPQRLPVAQIALADAIVKRVRSKKQMRIAVEAEYRGIVQSLLELDVGFRILNLDSAEPAFVDWARGEGCSSLQFPISDLSRWLIYPRDMAVYLEQVDLLLMHSGLFHSRATSKRGTAVIYSTLAEGGRVLFAGNRVLLGRPPGRLLRGERSVIGRLQRMGLRVADLPSALVFSTPGPGLESGLFHDAHLDRCAGLLMDKRGDCHLILDPGYQTGPLLGPHSPAKSIDMVRRACAKLEIEVHVPRSMTIPMATALVQFKGGRVLTTSGDDDCLALIGDIVGAELVHTTKIPLLHYPVFAGAGIHCMLTESPKPLVGSSGTFG